MGGITAVITAVLTAVIVCGRSGDGLGMFGDGWGQFGDSLGIVWGWFGDGLRMVWGWFWKGFVGGVGGGDRGDATRGHHLSVSFSQNRTLRLARSSQPAATAFKASG